MRRIVSNSLNETAGFAEEWLRDISSLPIEGGATIIGLSGHLGAGKTAFVKETAKILGVKEEVTSPTFVIMKIYEIGRDDLPWKRLVHIDAYRLERAEDLEALRFEDIAADRSNLVLVEWPERVNLQDFDEEQRLHFEMDNGTCSIIISGNEVK